MTPHLSHMGVVVSKGMLDTAVMLTWRATCSWNVAFRCGSSKHGKAILALAGWLRVLTMCLEMNIRVDTFTEV